MADEADLGNESAEKWLAGKLADAAEGLKKSILRPTGHCLYCGEALAPQYVFCPDDECAKDYEWMQQSKARAGR